VYDFAVASTIDVLFTIVFFYLHLSFMKTQMMLEYMATRLQGEQKVLASTLTGAAIFEQLRRCDCDEPALAVDEVAHQFVRVRIAYFMLVPRIQFYSVQ
jgi:hypothetical protein